MWSLFFPKHDENLIAILWEAGTTGIVEENDGIRAYFKDELQPNVLAGLTGEFRSESAQITVPDPDDCEPIAIGQRFYVVPPSFSGPVPDCRLTLQLHAGAAFGTGRHETTQLCLEVMERCLKPGAAVIDVGCGSGILSAAARLLGASRVISCDIDRNAVEIARRHTNEHIFIGSADAVAPHSADLVIANLTAAILDKLAWNLQRIAKPGGLLLLSGFLSDSPPRNYVPQEAFERNEWLCWICRPDAITASPPDPAGLTHETEWWL